MVEHLMAPLPKHVLNTSISNGDFRTYAIIWHLAWRQHPEAESPYVEMSLEELATHHPGAPSPQTIRGRVHRLTRVGLLRRERVGATGWRTFLILNGEAAPPMWSGLNPDGDNHPTTAASSPATSAPADPARSPNNRPHGSSDARPTGVANAPADRADALGYRSDHAPDARPAVTATAPEQRASTANAATNALDGCAQGTRPEEKAAAPETRSPRFSSEAHAAPSARSAGDAVRTQRAQSERQSAARSVATHSEVSTARSAETRSEAFAALPQRDHRLGIWLDQPGIPVVICLHCPLLSGAASGINLILSDGARVELTSAQLRRGPSDLTDLDLIDHDLSLKRHKDQINTAEPQRGQDDRADGDPVYQFLAASLANLLPEPMTPQGIAECLQEPALTAAWLAYVSDPAHNVRKPAAYLRQQVRRGHFPPTRRGEHSATTERLDGPSTYPTEPTKSKRSTRYPLDSDPPTSTTDSDYSRRNHEPDDPPVASLASRSSRWPLDVV